MKKSILSCFLFFATIFYAHAQEYYTSVGLRWGKMNSGISFKHLFDVTNAKGVQLEGYRTYIYDKGYTVKGFFIKEGQFRMPLLQIPLDWIWGPGLHAGYFPYTPPEAGRLTYGYRSHKKYHRYDKNVVTVGFDLTLQIEYQVPRSDFPITISVDANPWFEFINRGPEYVDFGFTARYPFK